MITISIMAATIMHAIDTTIPNVALPHMQGSLLATQEQIAWVLTSYILAAAIMTPPTGVIALKIGRRRLFIISILGFSAVSALCGLAGSLTEMVIYRTLQGAFGASLIPLSQATLLDTYPKERHGEAMALWGMGFVAAPIFGPTVGGYLTEAHDWRWIFYINVPVGLLAALGVWANLPDTKIDREANFDWTGFAFLGLAIGAAQMMLDRGESLDWFQSKQIVVMAAVSALALYLFIVHSLTAHQPLIEFAIFRDRNFVSGVLATFIVSLVVLAMLALLSHLLQDVLQYPAITAGEIMGPRGVGTMVAMTIAGKISGRTDPRYVITGGVAITASAFWLMTRFTLDVDVWSLVWVGFLQGFGMGFIYVPLSTFAFATLAPHYRTTGASLFSLMRNLGASAGIAALEALLARNRQVFRSAMVEGITPFDPKFREPTSSVPWDLQTVQGLFSLSTEVDRQATMLAYLADFQWMTGITLLIVPLLLVGRRRR
ncbi:MAG: DHA2 family efflux MFS transporter permease subunit [Proteobacteria bacterium]|nr:DHA2 family efflux MFS transporter permease subunit [Pseudomonadota bacterium]MBI3497085.1 DHA2 family efflux MFS transporter permease subunit [Pseudomonadota bacterium]